MRIELHVEEGPHAGEVFTFNEHGSLVVGRTPEVHIRLSKDRYLSRVHCLVEVNPPLCRVTDLGSTNGTRVNGKCVPAADLASGDEIRGGKTVLRVKFVEEVPATLVLEGDEAEEVETETLPPQPAPASGSFPLIPGYRLEEVLGQGGMGTVYRAVREADGLAVAIKTIRPAVAVREADVKRFLREAAVLRELDHPHIVGYRDSGAAGGVLYFVMDLVPGVDAGRLVERDGPLEVGRAVRLVCQVLEGLGHAHERGFVHRDVKPANVLVQGTGAEEVARLADFGLARAYLASPLSGLTLSHSAGGTPQFMAPEQVTDFRSAQPAADQYAAAATLYYLLCGKTVFPGRTVEQLFNQVLTGEPTPLEKHRPGLPAGLWPVLKKALSREENKRYTDAAMFARELLLVSE